jgi:hypothetical protein
MPLPTKFDGNEFFIIVIGLILSLIIVRMLPKRFTYTTSIVIFLYNISIAIAVDHVLAGPPFDLYDVMDSKKFELMDLVLYFFVYGFYTYVIIYIYDKWFYHKHLFQKFIYLVLVSLISIFFEDIAGHLEVYKFKGWKHRYSFPIYFVVFFINFYLVEFLKNKERNNLMTKKAVK